MLATALTAALVGVEAHIVRVEADTAPGFPKFTMVGLPDSAVKESEGRIRAALRNCGYGFGWDRRIIVNLAPAGLRKAGASYDLATAVGLLAADGALPAARLGDVLLIGELALDGSIRPVPGVLPMALAARRSGATCLIVAHANAAEAGLVTGLEVHPASSLPEAVGLAAASPRPPAPPVLPRSGPGAEAPDLADVRGNPLARRALEIAAAGGHNMLLSGPPGSGKTMLARRLPGLLPPLGEAESLEATAVHSAAGLPVGGILRGRPFRSPHHTASDAALVGGGALPRPGEVSLAHHGVLFLDELPEFRRSALEALRQPLEERRAVIARARGCLTLPARFQLVAAMNPCPCGYRGHPRRPCACGVRQQAAYLSRLSGPLLDRIDLHAEVETIDYDALAGPPGEATRAVAARVEAARATARERGQTGPNAELAGQELRAAARLDGAAVAILRAAIDGLALSARAHDRILRVARTIADLEGGAEVRAPHLAEALQYRPALTTPRYGTV